MPNHFTTFVIVSQSTVLIIARETLFKKAQPQVYKIFHLEGYSKASKEIQKYDFH